MPAYKSQRAEDELNTIRYNSHFLDKEWKKAYYQKEAELRTVRNTLLDASSGIAIASATLFLFVFRKRPYTNGQLRQLRTLNKQQFFLWFNAGWLLLFVALHWYYLYRGARGDFPPFADSIGIPLMYGETALLWCWPFLNGLLLLALWPAKLPASLFVKARQYTWRAILVESWWGFLLLLAVLYAILTVIDGDHLTIPVALLFVYLLLTLRAGYIQMLGQ
ncbi:hypothetical protein [Hymenobacter profundi]|uniref:DUF4328 domain-containing protein n=1 Tax=Hymenobacter profundi TaxID=1982110 RepID=A0ABS6WU00_9BACT|nr:hypothetical protein [Hymenobacter profundi]MBW3126951.1 hypothetical protein [Hymenobacter profundi]MBW3127058.1 hypothetical protein [Hymenobacter profundi]